MNCCSPILRDLVGVLTDTPQFNAPVKVYVSADTKFAPGDYVRERFTSALKISEHYKDMYSLRICKILHPLFRNYVQIYANFAIIATIIAKYMQIIFQVLLEHLTNNPDLCISHN